MLVSNGIWVESYIIESLAEGDFVPRELANNPANHELVDAEIDIYYAAGNDAWDVLSMMGCHFD